MDDVDREAEEATKEGCSRANGQRLVWSLLHPHLENSTLNELFVGSALSFSLSLSLSLLPFGSWLNPQTNSSCHSLCCWLRLRGTARPTSTPSHLTPLPTAPTSSSQAAVTHVIGRFIPRLDGRWTPRDCSLDREEFLRHGPVILLVDFVSAWPVRLNTCLDRCSTFRTSFISRLLRQGLLVRIISARHL